MLEQPFLTSTMQLEALRLLSEWWDGARGRRPGRSRRPVGAGPGAVAADRALPSGAPRARLDERLAQPS